MASDNTTTTFIACIIVGFLLIRWLISPSSSGSPNTTNSGISTAANNSAQYRRRRQVTQGMIEVVQSVAPNLSVEQIRYDLERSGSVELTIDRILAEGSLPYPPDYQPNAVSSSSARAGTGPATNLTGQSTSSQSQYTDLITRYNLKSRLSGKSSNKPTEPTTIETLEESATVPANGKKPSKWSQSKEERQRILKKQREEMILRARQKLEAESIDTKSVTSVQASATSS
ncbi:hypothetical protein V1511DRAFT_28462 [Dipodascopsis uninucleata]